MKSVADGVARQIDSIANLSASNAENAEKSRNLTNQSEAGSRRLTEAASVFKV